MTFRSRALYMATFVGRSLTDMTLAERMTRVLTKDRRPLAVAGDR